MRPVNATGRGHAGHDVLRSWPRTNGPALEDEILPQPSDFLEAYRKLMKV
jgi:hypothetical protein